MNCEIIRDLLPLYHDEVVSEESRGLVEEHLKTCAECRQLLADIHESVRVESISGEEQPMASGIKVLRDKLRRRIVTGITIAIIGAVALVSALTYSVFFYETPVPYSELTRTIAQPAGNALDLIASVSGHKSIVVFQEGDAVYISCSDTFWTRYIAKPHRQTQLFFTALAAPNAPNAPADPNTPTAPNAPSAPNAPATPGFMSEFTETPEVPEVSETPEAPEAPEAPDAPEPDNPFVLISEAARVYYIESAYREYTRDYAAFSEAVENAVLIWEKGEE